jgi:hypothetical protein
MTGFQDAAVAKVFAACPPAIRKRLLALRRMIFAVASKTAGVGKLQETLKWGEPAYVTAESGSGSTIRINRRRNVEGQYAIYFHCQTTLVETFRTLFPNTFKFEGNRSIVFDENDRVPVNELTLCIAMALTYHRQKRAGHSVSVRRRSATSPATRSRVKRASG